MRIRNEKNEQFKDQFTKGLKAFIKDEKVFEDYKGFIPANDSSVLLRFYKFTPEIAESRIIMKDLEGNLVKASETLNSVITPVAKVLVDCNNFEKGDIVIVSHFKVRGEVPNPEWQIYLHAQEAKGVEAIEPEDQRKFVPFMELNWRDHMYVRPWLYTPEEEDRLTYLLNSYEIMTKWDYEAFLTT